MMDLSLVQGGTMAQRDVRFEWNGKTYEIPGDVYDKAGPVTVVLSESEAVVLSGGWLESFPPKPAKINSMPVSVAESANALKVYIGADYIAEKVNDDSGAETLRHHAQDHQPPEGV